MEPLYDKILVFLIQLPPSLQIAEGLDLIKNLQYQLYPSFIYAIRPFPILDYNITCSLRFSPSQYTTPISLPKLPRL